MLYPPTYASFYQTMLCNCDVACVAGLELHHFKTRIRILLFSDNERWFFILKDRPSELSKLDHIPLKSEAQKL